MKILHVSKKYTHALGGDAVVVANLEKQQTSQGHSTVILTSNCTDIIDDKHVYKFGLRDSVEGIDRISIKRLISLVYLFIKSYEVIRKERPTVIHTHSVDMAYVVSFAARYYNVPIIHTFHIVTFNDAQQSIFRRKSELHLLRGSGAKVVTAPNMYEVNSLLNAGVNSVRILPNGVDLSQWGNNLRKPKNTIFQFVAVGRLEAQKDFGSLIEAAKLLKAERSMNFHITIVGDGSRKNTLLDMVDRMGLTSLIDIKPYLSQPELNILYARSDAFVISSLWETTPLTLLEAWAAGLPVVSTPVGILRNESTDRVAVIAETNNPKSLVSSMKRIMLEDSLAKNLTHNSSREVREKYTWNHIRRTAEDIYAEAVK